MTNCEIEWLPDWNVTILKGSIVKRDDVGVWEKLKAIIGVNPELGYCGRHGIYYRQYDLGVYDEFWLCPECYHNALERYRSRR